jgi:hypothetical protein
MFWELGDVKILFSFDVGMSAKKWADDSKSFTSFTFHRPAFICRSWKREGLPDDWLVALRQFGRRTTPQAQDITVQCTLV